MPSEVEYCTDKDISDSEEALEPCLEPCLKPWEDPSYFNFSDELVTFWVEGVSFTIHKYYFVRDSVVFRDLFALPPPPGQPVEGSSKEHPIRLEGASSVDFAKFLVLHYPKRIGHEDLSTSDDWKSVLSIADKFEFINVRELALGRLSTLASPMDKICLGHRYSRRDFLFSGYRDICLRDEPLAANEIKCLDEEDVALITAKRETLSYQKRTQNRTYSNKTLSMTDSEVEKYFEKRLPSVQ
ncbi:hypothetical protein DFH11DRAFT_1619815 [Phellopilus nigrolimitatus]|nr:hypothetical protein DFH11DRAFT_1619815 [Phellopilus nigrolimitatus]